MSYDLENIPSASTFLEAYADSLVYHDAVWLTAHNAFANGEDGWQYKQQNLNLVHMFEQGVRSFMLDVYDYKNDLYLCHNSCSTMMYVTQRVSFSGPDKLETWFYELRGILQTHPTDIISLHLECYAFAADVISVLKRTGLDTYMLKSKKPNDSTLTLGEMRKNSERLVVFSDYAQDRQMQQLQSLASYEQQGLFSTLHYKETQYSIDTYNDCTMRNDFRASASDPTIKLVVFNHLSSISAIKDYGSINRYSDIMKRVNSCWLNGLLPNFIAVDFFELGDCSKCISTKNVVYTLNILRPAMQNNTKNATGPLPLDLPTYSHIGSFYEYCKPYLGAALIFALGVAVGRQIYRTKPDAAGKLKVE